MNCRCGCGHEVSPRNKTHVYYSDSCKRRAFARLAHAGNEYVQRQKKKSPDLPGAQNARCPHCQMSGGRFVSTHLVTDWLGALHEVCPYRNTLPMTRPAAKYGIA